MDRQRIDRLNAKRLATLEPCTRRLAERHLEDCLTEGIELLVVQAYRSPEAQARLYAQGRTSPGKIVTNAGPGRSWHNYGRAYDVAVITDGRVDWQDAEKYSKAGEIGSRLGLVWGGSFKNIRGDLGHYEYHPGLTLEDGVKL